MGYAGDAATIAVAVVVRALADRSPYFTLAGNLGSTFDVDTRHQSPDGGEIFVQSGEHA